MQCTVFNLGENLEKKTCCFVARINTSSDYFIKIIMQRDETSLCSVHDLYRELLFINPADQKVVSYSIPVYLNVCFLFVRKV